MNKDYVVEQVIQKISKDKKVNQLEVEKAVSLTFKGLNELMSSGVKRVKVPHLGVFRQKENSLDNLPEDDYRRLNNRGGGNTSIQSGSESN